MNDKVKGSKGPVVFIVVFAVIAAAIGFYLYQQQTDSSAADAKHRLAAALPVLAGPEGRYAQDDVTSFARTNSGATIAGGDFAGCAPSFPSSRRTRSPGPQR